ncbi:MAG: hypothetical protein ACKO5C_02770 [Ferruginibacter sp.]
MDILIVILLVLLFNTYLIRVLSDRFPVHSDGYLWTLFVTHYLLTSAYMIYAFSTTSDSFKYYEIASSSSEWLALLEIGTSFIHFLAWPFASGFGLSYIATTILFSYFGYLAILYLYVTVKENISLKPVFWGLTFAELVFLLPNLHFWSSSIGKGSVILMGLSFFIFGLSRINRRFIWVLAGALMVFFVRPHIFITLVVSVMLGLLITQSGIKGYLRWPLLILSAVVFLYLSSTVLSFTETESFDITSSNTLAHRAKELSKSTSGVNIQEYGTIMKLFTFWFRPLFVDGLGVFGFIASIENLLFLTMFIVMVKEGISSWSTWNAWFRICLFIFLLGSFILSQVTGNLGIAIRQKAQFMPFFFIVFLKGMSYANNRVVYGRRLPQLRKY